MKELFSEVIYVCWLAQQAGSGLTYYWPVSLILLLGVFISAFLKPPFRTHNFQSRGLILLMPTFVSVLMLALGSAMHDTDLSIIWPRHVLLSLLIIQILISIVAIWKSQGFRWFAAFSLSFQLWFGIWCEFVSTMSVTGDWL